MTVLAVHFTLNELIRSAKGARSTLVNLETCNEEELFERLTARHDGLETTLWVPRAPDPMLPSVRAQNDAMRPSFAGAGRGKRTKHTNHERSGDGRD